MLIDVEGDILLSRADAVAQGVAPNDPCNQGLALQLRERSPEMYRAFRQHCHQAHPAEGDLWTWDGDGRPVYHLFTQENAYGEGGKPGKASLPSVNHALRKLRQALDEADHTSIAVPRLATGVGGLAWPDVRAEMEKHLGDSPVKVYVYGVYHPGVQADEAAATGAATR